jgi:hypothetical protein
MKITSISIEVAAHTYCSLEDVIRYYIQENHGTENSEDRVQQSIKDIQNKIDETVDLAYEGGYEDGKSDAEQELSN